MKYIYFALVVLFASLTIMLGSPAKILAANTPQDAVCQGISAGNANACNADAKKGTGLSATLTRVLRLYQLIAGVLAIFYMIYAGVKFITSGGSSEGVKGARSTILYASIGLIVVLTSVAIVQFVLERFS